MSARKRIHVKSLPAILLLIFVAMGPVLAPAFDLPDPNKSVGGAFAGPSSQAPLGTDRLGASVLSGLVSGGARLVLAAAVIGCAVTALSVLVAGAAALHPRARGAVEALSDAALLIPPILILLLVPVLVPDAGIVTLVSVCVALGLPFTLKVVFSALASVAQQGFVVAAVDGGESTWSVLRLDLVPAAASVLRSVLGLRIVEALYLLSVASFLGVDSGLGDHSWSTMVRTGIEGVLLSSWAVTAPAVMLALSGAAIFALTRGGDATDPEAVSHGV